MADAAPTKLFCPLCGHFMCEMADRSGLRLACSRCGVDVVTQRNEEASVGRHRPRVIVSLPPPAAA